MTPANWMNLIGLVLLFIGQCFTWYVFNHKAHVDEENRRREDDIYRNNVTNKLNALQTTIDDPMYGLKTLAKQIGQMTENCTRISGGLAQSTGTLQAVSNEHERRLNRIDKRENDR